MLVKDQLRIRMEQLDMPVSELAKRLHVSSQTVRHWLNGRSFPGKSKAPEVEKALSFKLDYSEGAAPRADTVESSLARNDVEIFLVISRLPPEVKAAFGKLAKLFDQYASPAITAEVGMRMSGGARRSAPRPPPAR